MAILRGCTWCLWALGCMLLCTPIALAQPQNGWWWNPNESGRGFFIEMTDDTVYVGGYFYENDGRATWLTSGGPIVDPYLYQGRLQSYRNGQTVFGPYKPPAAGVDAGPITIKFTDDTHGTLTWAGGTIPIERVVFDEGVATFQPVTGWWWNDAESGTGYSVEVQGSTMFVVAFMYDDAGNPVWYYSAGPMTTPTHYEGDWLQFAGGQTLGGPYKPPGAPAKLGRVIIDFAAKDDATIGFTDLAASAARAGTKQSVQRRNRPLIPRVPYYWSDQWQHWIGSMTLSQEENTATTRFSETLSFALVWVKQPQNNPSKTFYALQGNSKFEYKFRFSDSETGCSQAGDFADTAANAPGVVDGSLEVRDDLTYTGYVGTRLPLIVPIYETCPDPSGGQRTTRLSDNLILNFLEFGTGVANFHQSRILHFYPAYNYALGRTNPAMIGLRPLISPGQLSIHEWEFKAYP